MIPDGFENRTALAKRRCSIQQCRRKLLEVSGKTQPPHRLVQVLRVPRGADFEFGKARCGNAESLARLGDELGFSVDAVEPVGGGDKVSSTGIREAIARGDMAAANQMSNRPMAMEATNSSHPAAAAQADPTMAELQAEVQASRRCAPQPKLSRISPRRTKGF